MDNQLPSGPNGPAYAQTPGGVMWVAIYEKAYAKFRGGYENIDGGWGDVGLHELTGQPTQRLNAGDTSLAEIDRKIRDGFAVTSGSKSDDSQSSNKFTDGDLIVTSHEYSVERVDMNSHPPTITLLNPWGSVGEDQATGSAIPQEIVLTEDEWHEYFDEVGVTRTKV